MQNKMFSVYDHGARAFITPFFLPTIEMAKRVFIECSNAPTHQFCKYAEDYDLFLLGEWDDATGEYQANKPHKLLLKAAGVKVRQDAVPDSLNQEVQKV